MKYDNHLCRSSRASSYFRRYINIVGSFIPEVSCLMLLVEMLCCVIHDIFFTRAMARWVYYGVVPQFSCYELMYAGKRTTCLGLCPNIISLSLLLSFSRFSSWVAYSVT